MSLVQCKTQHEDVDKDVFQFQDSGFAGLIRASPHRPPGLSESE